MKFDWLVLIISWFINGVNLLGVWLKLVFVEINCLDKLISIIILVFMWWLWLFNILLIVFVFWVVIVCLNLKLVVNIFVVVSNKFFLVFRYCLKIFLVILMFLSNFWLLKWFVDY